LGVRRAIYFGDSTADMAAARAAGLPAVGVRPPGMGGRCGWPRKMKDAGAARRVEDLAAELECFL
jgi:phosphoglycolate phosphatase-like HAD superfamily hydrolase